MARFAVPRPGSYVKTWLPSPVETSWSRNDRVPLLYFPPSGSASPKPAVAIIHSYGSSKEEYSPIGPHLRRMGYGGLIFDLPFHGERAVMAGAAPCPSRAVERPVFPFAGDLSLYTLVVAQMIADACLCLGWLGQRPEIDASRLAAVGFSLGGVLTSVLCGLGLGLAASVAVMAAGDWGDVIYSTALGAGIRADLERAGVGEAEARAAFGHLSASTYAESAKDLLIIGGLRDSLVPRPVIHRFWSRIDHSRNRLVWKNSGHVPPVRSTAREVIRFVREKLRACPPGKEAPGDDHVLRREGLPRYGPALSSLLRLP